LKGEVDFSNSQDAAVRISSATPIFDTSTNVQDCVRRIEIVPMDVALAPTIEQLEFHGDVFGTSWKFGLRERGPASVAPIANQTATEFHFCTGTTTQGEVFSVGVHPRPQPSPSRRKPERRR
jgi:hypothetical protein